MTSLSINGLWGLRFEGVNIGFTVFSEGQPPAGPSVPIDQSSQASPDQSTTSADKPRVERVFHLDPLQPVDNLKTKSTNSEAKAEEDFEQIVAANSKYTESSADGVIHIQTLMDDSKQLFFRFDKVPGLELDEPNFSNIYEKVRYSLYKYSNFADLDKQSDYLTGVVKLIEAAYFGNNNINEEIQALFVDLANELEILPPDEEEEEEECSDDEGCQKQEEEVLEEEAEPQAGGDQSGEDVSSTTVDVSSDGTQETRIFQDGGMQVKITTKVVKPLQENTVERTSADFSGQSYATEEDFEASQGTGHKVNIQDKSSEQVEDKDNTETIDLEKQLLNTVNAELAENLKTVISEKEMKFENKENNPEDIDDKSVNTNINDRNTRRTIENVQAQSSSDSRTLPDKVTQTEEKSEDKSGETLHRMPDEL